MKKNNRLEQTSLSRRPKNRTNDENEDQEKNNENKDISEKEKSHTRDDPPGPTGSAAVQEGEMREVREEEERPVATNQQLSTDVEMLDVNDARKDLLDGVNPPCSTSQNLAVGNCSLQDAEVMQAADE